METIIRYRIALLRDIMQKYQLSAYIISGSDPHLSEYPADRWKTREWISGFTGSAGIIIITLKSAGLWTDSRYFIQASSQLKDSTINLYKQGLPETPSLTDFLLQELKEGDQVGLDGSCHSIQEIHSIRDILKGKNIKINISIDVIDTIWENRPQISSNKIFELPLDFTGISTDSKLKLINNSLKQTDTNCTILCSLDDIAWTFNIRGNDISYNPVATSYAFISENETILFINPEKLTPEIIERLNNEKVILADYSAVFSYLKQLPENTSILIDYNKTNGTIYNSIPTHCQIKKGISPATELKCKKNTTEIKGIHNSAIKDGIALTRFHKWLEEQSNNKQKITEISASRQLSEFRKEQALYLMDSFSTICGYKEHGAVVHYSATPESDKEITGEGMLLIDSGGQYLNGTTDITRPICIGKPTEQMCKDFTLILKGMINLTTCKFPKGTRGTQLDILARKALWDAGLNYLHGTGHGIGFCLNVHEGPQSIRMEENPVKLEPGMVLSNEPGLYRTGEYGIRIENMLLVCEDIKTEFGEFYSFETITLCYIETSLIISNILSDSERIWLNEYHQTVFNKLSPYLNEEEKIWLANKTKPISY